MGATPKKVSNINIWRFFVHGAKLKSILKKLAPELSAPQDFLCVMLGDCIYQHFKNLPTRIISQLFGAARTVTLIYNLVADNQTTCVQTPRELKLVNQAPMVFPELLVRKSEPSQTY